RRDLALERLLAHVRQFVARVPGELAWLLRPRRLPVLPAFLLLLAVAVVLVLVLLILPVLFSSRLLLLRCLQLWLLLSAACSSGEVGDILKRQLRQLVFPVLESLLVFG